MAGIQNSNLRIDVNNFHFIWKVAGFNKIPFISSYPIQGPSFSLNENSEALWHLAMAKEIRSNIEPLEDIMIFESTGNVLKITEVAKPEKAIGFSMIKSDFLGQTWETVKYFVQIKVGDITLKTEEKIENGERHYKTEHFHYIFSSDMKGVNLFDEETITIEAFIEHKQLDPRPLIPFNMVNRKTFTENLTLLFESEKYADIILKAGDCEIPAHRSILSSRSYGLEQHFKLSDHCDGDNTMQKLDLDLDESVAETLLIYAYCGRIPEDFPINKCPALYAAAEKYKIVELKEFVQDLLFNNVNSLSGTNYSDSEPLKCLIARLEKSVRLEICDPKLEE